MTRELSNTAKAAIFAQSTNKDFIVLATISHPNFTDDIRVADTSYELLPIAGERGVVSEGLEYVYVPFGFTMPQQDETGISRSKVIIDNTEGRVIKTLRTGDNRLSVTLNIVLNSNVDHKEVSMNDFRLERVTYNRNAISGFLSVEYFDLEPCPAGRFNEADFPGMF